MAGSKTAEMCGFNAILADELLSDTPLIEVYIDEICDRKNTSNIVIELNLTFALPELNHLKRVKGSDVLLFPCQNIQLQDVHSVLQRGNFKVSYLRDNIRRIRVAQSSPILRRQYDQVNKMWPCSFHANRYLENLSNSTLFTTIDVNRHCNYLSLAFNVAKLSKTENIVGVVIVDPKIDSIVAVGCDETIDGPCRHAVMVAVDNVAKTQNGGVWKKQIECFNKMSDLNLNGVPTDMYEFISENYTGIRIGSTMFKAKTEIDSPSDGPYLCTGYYVYTTHEPCIMCSMALVHSRAKRVFYEIPGDNGALGTLCKLHTVKELNHHFEVFIKKSNK